MELIETPGSKLSWKIKSLLASVVIIPLIAGLIIWSTSSQASQKPYEEFSSAVHEVKTDTSYKRVSPFFSYSRDDNLAIYIRVGNVVVTEAEVLAGLIFMALVVMCGIAMRGFKADVHHNPLSDKSDEYHIVVEAKRAIQENSKNNVKD